MAGRRFAAIRFNPRVLTSDGTHPAVVPHFGARAVAYHCVLLGADGRKADVARPRRSFGPVAGPAVGEYRPGAMPRPPSP